MSYGLFLFDADDTLFDFTSAEKVAFTETLNQLGIVQNIDALYASYRIESEKQWRLVEEGKITKEMLRTERFRQTFLKHALEVSGERAGSLYLEILPETSIMIDHAEEICRDLASIGEVGIVTNGFETVQKRRLAKSGLDKYISFMVVSEQCGFAKPDVRFFEHTAKVAKKLTKESTLVIGDRIETDVIGAHNFGVDACWFNPRKLPGHETIKPKYEIAHLSELRGFCGPA